MGMNRKRHIVNLSEDERAELDEFVTRGTRRAEAITSARIHLKADDRLTDEAICENVGRSVGTPHRTCKATEHGRTRLEFAPKPVSQPPHS